MNDASGYTYLAIPYSHPDPAVREERFQMVCRVAAHLMSLGQVIYSPIAHSHPIALAGELPVDWEYWKSVAATMIRHAEKLTVVMLPGWDQSKGVAAEIEMAENLGIPISYLMKDWNREIRRPDEQESHG